MNSNGTKKDKQGSSEIRQKKIFNKKKWREQKYSSKAKVLKWENIKRKQALRQYNKQLKKSGINFKDNEDRKLDRNTNFVGALKRAQLQFEKIKQEKERKRQEKELDRQQREAALKAYKEKKAMRNEKLFQKMRNGRVSMKGRLELMLEKIQKEYGKKEE
ncbi:hypothetical protein RUM43_006250 [Polyplax serrata]|uniref:Thyroid transcription factor 1-associated protein 26 n=1 Tax=Polyplax serrata TaxID=468196 RepID=A0AAN8PAZ8_POLSC